MTILRFIIFLLVLIVLLSQPDGDRQALPKPKPNAAFFLMNNDDFMDALSAYAETLCLLDRAKDDSPEAWLAAGVLTEASALREHIAELEQVLHALLDRLSPIMLPDQPKVETRPQAEIMLCPLADQIRYMCFMVGNITETVQDAHRLLQL